MQTARAARCALTSIFLTLILSCNLTNNRLTEEIVFLSAHAQGHMAGIGAFVSVDQSVRLFTTWPLGAQGGEPKCEKCLDELVPGTAQREWWRRSYRTTWSDTLRYIPLSNFRDTLTDGKWHQVLCSVRRCVGV